MYIDSTFPPPDGRLAQFARMLDSFARDEVETAVDWLIERLDREGGDPDLEDSDEDEDVGEVADQSWPEGDAARRKMEGVAYYEDGEDDDPDTCQAGDDGCAPLMTFYGLRAGSEHEDSDREPDNDAHDASWEEHHEMQPDVLQCRGQEDSEDDRYQGRVEYVRRRRARAARRRSNVGTLIPVRVA